MWTKDGKITSAGDKSMKLATTAAKCGRVIGAMTAYYLRDKNPVWTETCERMIQRLSELVVSPRQGIVYPVGSR